MLKIIYIFYPNKNDTEVYHDTEMSASDVF